MELQQVMWTTNAGLTDRHTYDSRPDSWPRLRRGIVRLVLIPVVAYADQVCRTSGSRIIARSTCSEIP